MGYHFGVGWLQGGFFSLDIFYVLSGYLITGLLVSEYRKRSRIQLSAFWLRRARRLLPALIIVLVATTLMIRFAEPARSLPRLPARPRSPPSSTSPTGGRSRPAATTSPPPVPVSPLTHTWSLAVEEQFYLIWPLVVLAVMHLSRNFLRGIRVLLVLSIAGALGSAIEMALLFHPAATGHQYHPALFRYRYPRPVHPGRCGHGRSDDPDPDATGEGGDGADRVLPTRLVPVWFLLGFAGFAGTLTLTYTLGGTSSFDYRGGFLLSALSAAAIIIAAVCVPPRTDCRRVCPCARWYGSAPSPTAPISGTTRCSCSWIRPHRVERALPLLAVRFGCTSWPRPATTWSNARSCTGCSGVRSGPPARPSP